MKPLKIGITGVRGIVGETFTPEVAAGFAQAFATYLDSGRILVCRDTRLSCSRVLTVAHLSKDEPTATDLPCIWQLLK